MKKLIFSVVSLIMFISCEQENEILDVNLEKSEEITTQLIQNYNMPDEDIFYLQKLGFAGSEIQVFEHENSSTGEKSIYYLLENDIEIPKDDLINLLPKESVTKNGGHTSQYRTQLIAPVRTYYLSYSGNNGTIRQGMLDAMSNFNNLELRIRFEESPGGIVGSLPIYKENTIYIIESNLGGAGGRAGFPSFKTRPKDKRINRGLYLSIYQKVKIDPATINLGPNIVEHVLTHEIGHCIGLRHTDFFNRSLSCGTGGNEGSSNVGAIHIPGTPKTINIDRNSIMSACFSGNETGEFTSFDIVALRELW